MSAQINWRLHVPLAIALAIALHALTVWALPRVIMDRIITLGGGDAARQGSTSGVFLPPPTDHTQRRIVMPSPDLLYATCAYDLGDAPLRVQLSTDYPRYWSIALYATNSDNFFVINDRDAAGEAIDLLLLGPQDQTERIPDGASGTRVVRSPTERGFLLMRVLVNEDPTVRADADRTRRQLRCQPIS